MQYSNQTISLVKKALDKTKLKKAENPFMNNDKAQLPTKPQVPIIVKTPPKSAKKIEGEKQIGETINKKVDIGKLESETNVKTDQKKSIISNIAKTKRDTIESETFTFDEKVHNKDSIKQPIPSSKIIKEDTKKPVQTKNNLTKEEMIKQVIKMKKDLDKKKKN